MPFASRDLYELEAESFEVALQILSEWRREKSYAGKVELFDQSVQVDALASQGSHISAGRARPRFRRLNATSLDTSFVITPPAR